MLSENRNRRACKKILTTDCSKKRRVSYF